MVAVPVHVNLNDCATVRATQAAEPAFRSSGCAVACDVGASEPLGKPCGCAAVTEPTAAEQRFGPIGCVVARVTTAAEPLAPPYGCAAAPGTKAAVPLCLNQKRLAATIGKGGRTRKRCFSNRNERLARVSSRGVRPTRQPAQGPPTRPSRSGAL